MTPDPLLITLTAMVGLCIGSFLNVLIHRLPLGESIVRPGSRCPACGRSIRFYDNLPVVSYLLLRARCRACGASIPLRYPLVELITGALAVGLLLRFGLSPLWPVYFTFCAALVAISFIDLDHMIIPNVISLPGIPIAFLAALWLPGIGWRGALLGILAGGGSLWLVATVYLRLTGKEGMGFGDVKLLAMIGALIGWQGVLFTLFAASAAGSLFGAGAILAGGGGLKHKIPFGPFLSIGAIAYLFCGPEILAWYLGVTR